MDEIPFEEELPPPQPATNAASATGSTTIGPTRRRRGPVRFSASVRERVFIVMSLSFCLVLRYFVGGGEEVRVHVRSAAVKFGLALKYFEM
jgi:hypothetical protein